MSAPKRQLGFVVAAAIVVANMIGSGVFAAAGFQAALSFKDPWTMMSTWIVGGIVALCGASVYAELGSLMPRAGGEYVYLREAYHPALGFMSGWVSLVLGFSAPIAAAALLFASYVAALFPGLGGPIASRRSPPPSSSRQRSCTRSTRGSAAASRPASRSPRSC